MKYEIGSKAYIVVSNRIVREVTIVNRKGDYYVVRFADGEGGTRLKEYRLFPSEEAAKDCIPGNKNERKTGYRLPYDYM